MSDPEAIIWGLCFGSLSGSILFFYLLLTRASRRLRNKLALLAGYVLIPGSAIGCLLLLFQVISGHSPQQRIAQVAYTISFAVVGVLGLRSQLRWRKVVGLGDKL